ncbi:hypothetical protein ACFXHA_28425 [Nocardia sp. NPDC059240]|uniref:DUF7373 family lipoprotein n=1 Tax=Nocardia sp. NPDC059240 TaxID=3346786 RepID=UPI00369F331F
MATVVFAVLAAAATGCGETAGAAPDYGHYLAHRVDGDYDRVPSRARGILAESLRLGEHIVYPADIDPDLSQGHGGGVVADFQGVTQTLSTPQQQALKRYSVLGGFAVLASNKSYLDNSTPRKFLSVAVLAFPDPATAASAAADMEHADFQANTDNVPVTIDPVPTAISHWRPGVANVGSWLAWKSLVIRVLAELPAPDLGPLTDLVARTYQRQEAALESYTPTSATDLPALALDSDALLPRLVKTGDYLPDDKDFAVYGPHAYAVLSRTPGADAAEYTTRGVTAIAVSHNKHLFRTRDAAAAADLARTLSTRDDTSQYRPVRGVSGQSDTTCAEASKPDGLILQPRRFRCLVVRDAFVAMVYANTDIEVRQLAAAQFAVMGDAK